MKNLLRSGLLTASLLALSGAQAAAPAPTRQASQAARSLDRVVVAELEADATRRINTVGRRAYRAEIEARWSHSERNHRS
jgi:hypothetical protein